MFLFWPTDKKGKIFDLNDIITIGNTLKQQIPNYLHDSHVLITSASPRAAEQWPYKQILASMEHSNYLIMHNLFNFQTKTHINLNGLLVLASKESYWGSKGKYGWDITIPSFCIFPMSF